MDELFDARAYWLERIKGAATPSLPLWRGGSEPAATRAEIDLDAETAARLRALTGGQPLLDQAVMVACVQSALSLHTRAARVAVVVPPRAVAGSSPAPNALPIVQTVAAETPCRELLAGVRRSLLDAYAIQDYPLRPLCDELGLREGPAGVGVVLSGAEAADFDPPPPLLVRAVTDANQIHLTIEARRAFAASALRLFLDHVARILAAIVRDHGLALARLPLLTDEERETLLTRWNATAAEIPGGSVVSWIERQAAERSDAEALSGALHLTYGELNARANRLARLLQAMGVRAETRVALYLADPGEMIVSLLAVLKAGGAYVPLDPAYPRARIEHMLVDSAARVVVTSANLAGEMPPWSGQTLVLGWQEDVPDHDLGLSIHPDQLAYVIYTSGSTGRPRGVLVRHGGLANTIHHFATRSEVGPGGRVSQFCSFSFDASALEIFVALTRGATLCVAPRVLRGSPEALGQFLREERVTVIGAVTPSVLFLIDPAVAPDVRAIHIGAEKCSAALADLWGTGRALVNCYGPTEATIDCIAVTCLPGEGDPPIGRPIENTRAYVLDDEMQPVPMGMVGELYVGGEAVSRGYQNLPDVTAVKYVPDPFSPTPGGRLYRSGDLARWRTDGRLDFCGRADRQVKIDGLRIEPEEIEAVLASHPAVLQCAVDVRGDRAGQGNLVAYFVARGEVPPSQDLREHVALSVPAYMLPSAFVPLDRLPTTANGKIDRAALPDPRPVGASGDAGNSAGPTREIEQALAAIWAEILGVDDIGPQSNFFDLGGRSLHVTRVLSKVAKAYQVQLPLELMFKTPKLADFAREIAAAVAKRPSAPDSLALVPPQPRPDRLPLSSAQQRLWFLQQVLPSASAALYNGPLPVLLEGPLDREALVNSFKAIIRRHEVLRTAFLVVDDSPVQEVLADCDFSIDVVDLTALEPAGRIAEANRLVEIDARRPFNLEQPPLLRATLVKLADREHLLLANIHHIVFDGWSAAVFLNELTHAYDAYTTGACPSWAPLALQYADFSLWQRRWLASPAFDQQLAYWRKQLAGVAELQLPRDHPRPAAPTYAGEIEQFRLSGELREKLVALSRDADVTLFMTLLAGFKALLHRYTSQEDIAIGSPVANRKDLEVERLIGFFVNSVVLRTSLAGTPTFRELLTRVRRVTLDAYDHQDIPFEKLVEHLQPERMATHNPLFQAALSLQNVPLPSQPSRDLRVTPWETHNKTTKFDLVFAMIDDGTTIVGDVEYCSDLFERSTIREMIALYARLLASVAANPDASIVDVPLTDRPPASAAPQTLSTFDF